MPRTRAVGTARRVRRVIGLVAVSGLVATAVSAAPTLAQDVPEQVLQSVRVQVGPDGTVTAVDSQAVRKPVTDQGDDDAVVVDDAALDPTAVADRLPVRVLTSYQLGDRSGTDLTDIEGESGRVVVSVTVQNTTVRPEQVTYDSGDGAGRTDYALVGAPLTVVASTALGSGDLARIVTRNDVAPNQVTNGVLSQADDGSAQVQWAAMLAPPRLAASATFTLVEETADFVVPRFDVAVQPGLVTDTSVKALIDSAFSDDSGSTLRLESKTIQIISSVNTELTSAGSVLSDIRSTLASSARDLGNRTIAELRGGRDQVDGALTDLVSRLESLDAEIEAQLRTNNTEVLSKLNTTLDDVRVLLGDPDHVPSPHLAFSGACGSRIPTRDPDAPGSPATRSVLYQMRLVGAQLDALRRVSAACTRDIKAGLRSSIGTLRGDCSAPGAAGTAICTLDAAVGTLQSRAAQLGEFESALTELADPQDSIAAVRSSLDALSGDISDLQALAAQTASHASLGADLVDDLTVARQQLVGVQVALGQLSVSDIVAGYGDLADLARSELDALGTPGAPGTTRGRAEALATALQAACAVPTVGAVADPDLLPQDAQDYLTVTGDFLTSQADACSGVDAIVDALRGDLAARAGAWQQALDLTDVSAEVADFQDAVGAVDTLVGSAIDDVDAAIAAGTPEATTTAALMRQLDADLGALFDAGLLTPVTEDADQVCVSAVTGAVAPLNDVRRAFNRVACNNRVLEARIGDEVDDFRDIVSTTQDVIESSKQRTGAARRDAETSVGKVTRRLGGQIDAAGKRVVDTVDDGVRSTRDALAAAERESVATLGAQTDAVVSELSSRVGSSNRDLMSTRDALQADLAAVLFDLGSGGAASSGILGTLSTSARRTGGSTADLADVSARADAFRSVRGQELDQIFLEQAQTDRGLRLQAELPAIGLDLPEGSSVLTVFTFHIGRID